MIWTSSALKDDPLPYLFGVSVLWLVSHRVLPDGSGSSVPVELHGAVSDAGDPQVASRGHWH